MIEVTCAIIVDDDKILATKRSHAMHLAGKWEFAGGKIEKNESAEECIVREIDEELSIQISVLRQLESVVHQYPDKSIHLIPFLCSIISGTINLHEHADFKWLTKSEIDNLDWAEADRKLIEVNGLRE